MILNFCGPFYTKAGVFGHAIPNAIDGLVRVRLSVS